MAGAWESGGIDGLAELLGDLNAFLTEHDRCGDLDAGVERPVVWIACECGARIVRRADERDALASDS